MNTNMNQNGRSMIEMLGVLAIIGVLSVGGIAGYSKAMGKYKTNQVVDQVSMIVTNIRTLYAQQMDYSGLTNTTAVNMGVVPEELINKKASQSSGGVYTSVSLRNGFQGDVIIQADASRSSEQTGNGAKTAFVVEFQGLSRDACVSLATADWGSGSASGFIGLAVSSAPQLTADSSTGGTTGGNTGGNNGGNTETPSGGNTETPGGESAIGTSSIGAMDGETVSAVGATHINKLVIGCNGDTGAGFATACPNGGTVRVPLSVTTASAACACQQGNNCSIAWKYF